MQVEINGRSTGPGIQWPNGCRAAVMLTFDFEAETLRISNLARQEKSRMSVIRAVMAEMKGFGAVSKCWIPMASRAPSSPQLCIGAVPRSTRAIHASGHEIAYHGIMHEPQRDNSPEDEEIKWQQAEAVIQKITGRRPVGHRAPHSTLHPAAYDLMQTRLPI